MVPKVRTTRRWPMASGNPGAIGVSFDFFLGRKRDAHPSQEVTLIGTGICVFTLVFTADRFCLWRTLRNIKAFQKMSRDCCLRLVERRYRARSSSCGYMVRDSTVQTKINIAHVLQYVRSDDLRPVFRKCSNLCHNPHPATQGKRNSDPSSWNSAVE